MFTASQDQRVSGPAGTASADEGVGEAAEAALAAAWATDACCRVAGWGGHTANSPCSQTLRISACADRRGRTRPTKGHRSRSSRCRPGRRMGHGHMLPRSVVEFTGPTAHVHSFPRPARERTGGHGLGRRRGGRSSRSRPGRRMGHGHMLLRSVVEFTGHAHSFPSQQPMLTAFQDQRVSGPAGTASADEGVGEAAEAAPAAAWATDTCCRGAWWGVHGADSSCSQTSQDQRVSGPARHGLGRRRGMGAAAADAAPAAAWATDTCCRGAWWSSRGRQLMFTASQDQRVSGSAGTASADEGVGEAAEAALAAAWATDACCRVAGWGGHTADSPCSQTLRISACADRRGRTRPTKGWEQAADAAPAAAWATDTCCRGAWWSSRGRQLMFTASQDQRVSGRGGRSSRSRPGRRDTASPTADEGVGEKQQKPPRPPHGPRTHAAEERGGEFTGPTAHAHRLPKTSACADRRGRTRTDEGVGEAADAAPAAAWATDTCC